MCHQRQVALSPRAYTGETGMADLDGPSTSDGVTSSPGDRPGEPGLACLASKGKEASCRQGPARESHWRREAFAAGLGLRHPGTSMLDNTLEATGYGVRYVQQRYLSPGTGRSV